MDPVKAKTLLESTRYSSPSPSASSVSASSTGSSAVSSSYDSLASPPPLVLPSLYHRCHINCLEELVASLLRNIVEKNDKIPVTPASLTRFHSRAAPEISVADYLRRIVKYASVEKAVLLAILVYVDRICARHASFALSSLTIHRFLIAAVTVGAKTLCDAYCTNSHYARVGGLSVAELNTLELELLFMMEWQLACSQNILHSYYQHLVSSSSRHVLYKMASPPRRIRLLTGQSDSMLLEHDVAQLAIRRSSSSHEHISSPLKQSAQPSSQFQTATEVEFSDSPTPGRRRSRRLSEKYSAQSASSASSLSRSANSLRFDAPLTPSKADRISAGSGIFFDPDALVLADEAHLETFDASEYVV